MAGSRALKEVTLCKSHPKSTPKASAPKAESKQFTSPKNTNTGPNYPQWHLGKGGSVKGGV